MARLLATHGGEGALVGTRHIESQSHRAGRQRRCPAQNPERTSGCESGRRRAGGDRCGIRTQLAQALIDRSTAPPASSTGRTPFQAFKLSAQITNGIAETHDLTIASQALKVAGQGSANLPTKGIDFKLLASVADRAGPQYRYSAQSHGHLADPTVKPDLDAARQGSTQTKASGRAEKERTAGTLHQMSWEPGSICAALAGSGSPSRAAMRCHGSSIPRLIAYGFPR